MTLQTSKIYFQVFKNMSLQVVATFQKTTSIGQVVKWPTKFFEWEIWQDMGQCETQVGKILFIYVYSDP